MTTPNKAVWNARHGSKNPLDVIEEVHFQSNFLAAEEYRDTRKDQGFGARIYSYNVGPKNLHMKNHYVKVWNKKEQA